MLGPPEMFLTSDYHPVTVRTASSAAPLTPVCAWCSRRTENGYSTTPVPNRQRLANITHTLCRDCARIAFPGLLPYPQGNRKAVYQSKPPADIQTAKAIVDRYKPGLLKDSNLKDLFSGPYGLYKTNPSLRYDPTAPSPKEDLYINRQKVHNELDLSARSHPDQQSDPLAELLEDASTIVHEHQHQFEHTQHELGQGEETTEVGPTKAENAFIDWANSHRKEIESIPQVQTYLRNNHTPASDPNFDFTEGFLP